LWPEPAEVREIVAARLSPALFRQHYTDLEQGTAEWNALDANSYYRLGDLLMSRQRWEEARAVWSGLLLRHPDDLHGLGGSVEALSRSGRLGEAKLLIQRMIDLEEDPDRIEWLRATLARASNTR